MLHALAKFAQQLMTMDDAVWARHANPLSGWSRVSILPLLAMAVWSRLWIGWWAIIPVTAVLIWTWLNPRLFRAPASFDNWMSKGVLGERVWLSWQGDPRLAHHAPIIRALTLTTLGGLGLLLAGLAVLSVPLTTTGLAAAMLSKLWILDRMVWIYSEAGFPEAFDQATTARG